MKTIVVIVSLVLAWSTVRAQAYKLLGNATALGGDCYQLTKDAPNQRGVIWRRDQISLQEPFDIEFLLNFGDHDRTGADGMVFIMQTAGNDKLGSIGRDLGFSGFSPSLGVEFDTFQNNKTGAGNYGDPAFDHIAVVSNGSVNHNSANALFAPVQASATSDNIEDGKDHLVRIVWTPTTNELEVYFDCQKRVSLKKDLVAAIFEGKSDIWWGFSGTTGASFNNQTVCLQRRILFQEKVAICANERVTLTSRVASDHVYRWFPADGLDNTTVRNPKASPRQSTVYTVTYKNHCGNQVTDTITVSVVTPRLTLGKDTTLCEGQRLVLNTNGLTNAVLWNDGTTSPTLAVSQPGDYWVSVNENGCVSSDTIRVSYRAKPAVTLGNDTVFCAGSSVRLGPSARPPGLAVLWDNRSADFEREVKTAGLYAATLTVEGCSVTDTVRVFEKPVYRFSLGNERPICHGETISVVVPANAPPEVRFVWSTGSSADSIRINRPCTVWLESSQAACVYRDSLVVQPESCQDANVYIPDVFTPNGDGVNDALTLHYAGIDSYEFLIYDRWGKVIYKGEMNQTAWDGRQYPTGMYTWSVRYRFTDRRQQKREITRLGQVELWR